MKSVAGSQAARMEIWKRHLTDIEAHVTQGGTRTSYCKTNGISLANIRYWRKKLGLGSRSKEKPNRTNPAVARSAFIPVQVVRDEDNQANQYRLPDPKWLAELVLQLMQSSGGHR
jgi:hypothetical protein